MAVRLSGSLGSGDVNVGVVLNKAGTVSLKDVSTLTGGGSTIFGRTHASTGYRRINIYEKFTIPTHTPDATTPHGLLEFTGYIHTQTPTGNVDSVSTGINEISFDWTNPTHFNASSGSGNNIYWDTTAYTSEANAISNGVPTTLLTNSTAATFTKNTGLTADRWFVFDIQSTWDDSQVVAVDGARSGAGGYTLSGGIDVSIGGTGGGFVIGPVCSSTPSINSGGALSGHDSDACSQGSDQTHRINVTMCVGAGAGKIWYKENGGGTFTTDWISGGNVSADYNGNLDFTLASNKNWYFRLYYDSEGSTNYDEQGPVFVQCNLI